MFEYIKIALVEVNVNSEIQKFSHDDNEKTSMIVGLMASSGCVFSVNMQKLQRTFCFGWVRNLTDGRVEACLKK